MNRWTPLLIACVAPCLACIPPSKDGGAVLESSSSGASTGDGGSDTEAVPAACEAKGWDTSRAAFDGLVAGADGHYWYTTTRATYTDFTPDCSYSTTIEVAGGVVIRRRMPGGQPVEGSTVGCLIDPIDELGDDVGALDEYAIAPPWTLERLYRGCCDDALSADPDEDIEATFETFDNGVMRQCFAVSIPCADGCDFGPEGYGSIDLDEVGFGPLPD